MTPGTHPLFMYQMIYKYHEAVARDGDPQGEADTARGRAGHPRPLASDRCQFQGRAGEDGGGFCRRRSALRSDRILATRYMAESA